MLSVIVPVRNEAAGIIACLEALAPLRARGTEVIVVDGGSADGTADLARALADRVLVTAPGRALQQNAGAQAAAGDILLFLHADCRLPDGADAAIVRGLADDRRDWGRFDVRLTGRHPLLRMVERMMNLRSRATGIATGDQAIFVRRELFRAAGGFPPVALMEDIRLSAALKRTGPPLCLRDRVTASSRRWEAHGVMRTIALMWTLRLAHFFGADPARLARRYRPSPP